jgi:hypothetical protein
MFSINRIAALAAITAAAIVPTAGAQAANPSIDASARDASIASSNRHMANAKHAGPMTLETPHKVRFSREPHGWMWSDMSG